MEGNLYDEFGNYIGPELEEDNFDQFEPEEKVEADSTQIENNDQIITLVPHEEKVYYKPASEVYGGVETLVEEEDSQPITEPIIAPIKVKCFELIELELPETTFNYQYLYELMKIPIRNRHISLVGDLHSGKTSIVDMLVEETHSSSTATYGGVTRKGISRKKLTEYEVDEGPPQKERPSFLPTTSSYLIDKYTDTLRYERDRGVSIRSMPMSFVLSTSKNYPIQQNFAINIIDTPGGINFIDEVVTALRLTDGCILVVDAAVGLKESTKIQLTAALSESQEICLVINCLDRLIIELRLPPIDCYHKIRYIIGEINSQIQEIGKKLSIPVNTICPIKGNVCFVSSKYGICFSLFTFANMYYNLWGIEENNYDMMSREQFKQFFWGDVYFDPHPEENGRDGRKKFVDDAKTENGTLSRSFVVLILEPIYKIFGFAASEEKDELKIILEEVLHN